MNLIFRILRLFLLRKKLDSLTPLEVSHLTTKAWPLDCDFNLHLTNSRYPSLLDLARMKYLLQINAFSMFVGGGWKSVLSSQSIRFIKEIKPFSTIKITTQVLYWDRKYCYIEHQFLVADKLHAKALAQVVFIKGRRVRAYDKLLAELDGDYKVQSPEITDQVSAWLRSMENIKT